MTLSFKLQKIRDTTERTINWNGASVCEDNNQIPKFVCTGIFCGPSCARAYADHKGWSKSASLIPVIARLFGYTDCSGKLPPILPAPPREALKEYSGPTGLTIDEFRTFCTRGIRISFLEPVFTGFKQIFESGQQEAEMYSNKSTSKTKRGVFHRESLMEAAENIDSIVQKHRNVFNPRGTRTLNELFNKR
jgi:hypothetical protein